MTRAIFLSASVPDPQRHPKYHSTADRTAIRDAVRALVTISLPHNRLVWGGHPAITPLVRVIAEANGITDGDHVVLYQSNFFKGLMPRDNTAFERIIKVRAVPGDREASLKRMREKMLSSEPFHAGVFIGGMEGVEEEYHMFRAMHPNARVLPVASTGAAALLIFQSSGNQFPTELKDDLAYPSLFRRLLGLSST